MLALMNQFFVASSTQSGPSKIYDITGRVLASSGEYQQWAFAALPRSGLVQGAITSQ